MASKFGHVRLNRREKVWKEPSGCGVSKEQPLPFVWSPDGNVHLTRDAFEGQQERIFRKNVMKHLKKRLQSKTFTVKFPPNFGRPYKFAFNMNAKTFSQVNRLEMKSSANLFVQVKSRVEAMLPVRKDYKRDDSGDTALEFSCHLDELESVFK